MAKISEASRIIKRIILANITTEKKDLALTPLVSGRHGIGKSQIIKKIAEELGGTCLTIEGGTLKEGEITGIPYQYQDKNDAIHFRFLPYYVVERIQNEEKRIYLSQYEEKENFLNIDGDVNRYALNDIHPADKIAMLLDKKIKPVIIFIDEINRTDPQVYKELMNLLLTRSVNGYVFPWWVFFVGAMNPATSDSIYNTNEMDPAQLDRFFKISVRSLTSNWLSYETENGMSPEILEFIKDNPKMLMSEAKELDDSEEATPSPRGWDMIDTILKSVPMLKPFFDKKENTNKIIEKDLVEIISSKVGTEAGKAFAEKIHTLLNEINANKFFDDDDKLSETANIINDMSKTDRMRLNSEIIQYLAEHGDLNRSNWSNLASWQKKIKKYLTLLDESEKLSFAKLFSTTSTTLGRTLSSIYNDLNREEIIKIIHDSEDRKKSFWE